MSRTTYGITGKFLSSGESTALFLIRFIWPCQPYFRVRKPRPQYVRVSSGAADDFVSGPRLIPVPFRTTSTARLCSSVMDLPILTRPVVPKELPFPSLCLRSGFVGALESGELPKVAFQGGGSWLQDQRELRSTDAYSETEI